MDYSAESYKELLIRSDQNTPPPCYNGKESITSITTKMSRKSCPAKSWHLTVTFNLVIKLQSYWRTHPMSHGTHNDFSAQKIRNI